MNSIVVGGGPAGCAAAESLADEGSVTLFEEHWRQPVRCAGVLSASGLARLGIKRGDFVLNKVRGAKLYSPAGRELVVDGGETKAFIVDRRAFDEHTQERAVEAGAELVRQKVVKTGRGFIEAGGKRFDADLIVLASGAKYDLHAGLGLAAPKKFYAAAQYELRLECDPEFVELHFMVPDFFAWVAPAGDVARVGCATVGNPRPYMEKILGKLRGEGRLKSDKIVDRLFGVFPVYEPNLTTQVDGAVSVGDAAGHVKATTGGGVILGCLAAKEVAEPHYEQAWRRSVGGELAWHLKIRGFLNKLSAGSVERLFSAVEAGKSSLESGGDMDAASVTLKKLAANPGFALRFLTSAPRFLADII